MVRRVPHAELALETNVLLRSERLRLFRLRRPSALQQGKTLTKTVMVKTLSQKSFASFGLRLELSKAMFDRACSAPHTHDPKSTPLFAEIFR